MSAHDILLELPKLNSADRSVLLERLCELQDRDLMSDVEPSSFEKRILDQELEDYLINPTAGSSWVEVEARLRNEARKSLATTAADSPPEMERTTW